MSDLIERLELHRTWRDSHGELNDAPNEAAARIRVLEEILAGAVHFSDAVAYRGDVLSIALRQYLQAGAEALGDDA